MDFIKKFLINIFSYFCKQEQEDIRETPSPNQEDQATIGLIVGHSKLSGGALLATGGNEYSYNSKVAELAKAYAAKNYPQLSCHIIFRDGIGISGAYKKAVSLGCDVIIELHFNAFNKEVIGTETLCSSEKSDQEFSEIVHSYICEVFRNGAKSRGVKVIARSAQGGLNVYSAPGVPNCLVEPFFGDTPSEAEMAMVHQEVYANSLIESCVDYLSHNGVLTWS